MKKITFAFLFVVSAFTVSAQTWTLDKAHAKLGFGVTHLLVSDVEGNFKTFDATINASKSDFSDAVIDLSADVNSINTDNDQRDKHLKSADFFDATKFPSLVFKGKSLKQVSGKKYKLSGDLTIHGVTKPVELDVTYNGTIEHPYTKKPVAGFKVSGTIKRSDFGIGASVPNGVVSDEVEIVANAEFSKG
ncbi:MAG: YceI family protein [Agriterribacter sp.]